MPNPEPNPTDPRPDQAPTPTPTTAAPETAPDKEGAASTSTQENMGDGTGIRGDYGNASQTNGLEGGPDQAMTDTELTGS